MEGVKRLALPALMALLASVIPALMITGALANFAGVNDLPEYYAASRLILGGNGADAYVLEKLGAVQHQLFPAMGGRIIGFYLTPPGVVWIAPVGLLPLGSAPYVWTAILFGCLIAAVVLMARFFKLSLPQSLILWAVVIISGPAYESLRIGQLAPLLLLAFVLGLLALKADRPKLSVLAMSVMFLKPHVLLPFAVYMLGARRYVYICAMAALALIFSIMSLAILGPSGWTNYLALQSSSVENAGYMQPELNPTVRGQLLRIFPGAATVVMIASAAVLLIGLITIFILARKSAGSGKWLDEALVFAMPLGIVTCLHCHCYDLILLVPSVLAFVSSGLRKRVSDWLMVGVSFACLVYLLPFFAFIHYDLLLEGMIVNPLFVVLLFVSGGILHLAFKSEARTAQKN